PARDRCRRPSSLRRRSGRQPCPRWFHSRAADSVTRECAAPSVDRLTLARSGSSMRDLFRYDDKRVLVVGCASGMGAATARGVPALGAEVHGVDYKQPEADLASFTSCDLRDGAQVAALVESLDGPFHAVFYAAGLPQTHPPLDVLAVNYAALREVVEGVLPKM